MGLFARWSAHRRYMAAVREAEQAWSAFVDPDPAARREALLWAADCERTMSAIVAGVRGMDVLDEAGHTLAQSHNLAALLLTMVADTEPAQPSQRVRLSNLDDDPAVASTLAALAKPTGPRTRAVLTLTFHDLVVGRVGRRAAAVLAESVAYGYYRLSGLDPVHAEYLIRPDGLGRTR